MLLTSALLPFSSGSCETENIVGSEMNVSGKFVFPGKNRRAVAAATTPGPARRPPLALPFPTLCPALVLTPQTRTRSANPTSSEGCSGGSLPNPWGSGAWGAEPVCRAPPPRGAVCAQTRPPACSSGHREIHVIDTDYERYAILRLSLHWQRKDFHVLKYFSKPAGARAAPRRGPAGPPLSPRCPCSAQPGGRVRTRLLEVPGADRGHRALPGGPPR